MKSWLKLLCIGLIGAAVLAACSPAFVMGTGDLKGKVFTYYAAGFGGANGHDKTIVTFDSTGAAGTFEYLVFEFGYATQAAATSGKYTDKTWFQTSGSFKGTFTYNADTFAFSSTTTEYYDAKSGITLITPANTVAAADYAYQSALLHWTPTYPGLTAYSETRAGTTQFNLNNMSTVLMKGIAANSWVGNTKTTTTVTATTSVSTVVDATHTVTIADGSFVDDTLTVMTLTVGTAAPTVTTEQSTYNASIEKYFLVGGDTSDKKFADVWKKGNTATFQLLQNRYTHILYIGATAPTAPTPDTTTGIGGTNGFVAPVYYIDARTKVPNSFGTFASPATWMNGETYIVDQFMSALLGATRQLH